MRQRRLFLRGLVAVATMAAICGTAGLSWAAAEKKPIYQQQKDVIYGDSDGVALAMDVFTPTGAKNGIGIIDVASGAWHSDRGKIRDHMRAQVYDIFCGKGYTVFAVRPGSITRFSVPDMISHLPGDQVGAGARRSIRYRSTESGNHGGLRGGTSHFVVGCLDSGGKGRQCRSAVQGGRQFLSAD